MDGKELEKVVGKIHYKFWGDLHHNGWMICMEDADTHQGYDSYTMKFLAEYEVTCFARISTSMDGIKAAGHLGVAWIDALYEIDLPYSWRDLEDMKSGIVFAEENLLRIGVPFVSNYKFHGPNTDENAKKNMDIREKWNLNEIEKQIFGK